MSASLLGTDIHEIEASWTGPEELKQANYTLQSLPKGLKFLRVVPTSESPKVMGLVGIHDPDALWHFARFIYCPWCGKEGQNKGTVVNHLRTTHYRLGLVCDKCQSCPSTTCNTLCLHGHHNCCWVITPSELVPSDESFIQAKDPYYEVKVEYSTQVPPEGRLDWLAEQVVSAKLPAHLFFLPSSTKQLPALKSYNLLLFTQRF